MSFSLQLGRFKKKALEDTERARREILLRTFRAVIYDTPVLEGTLRGNWQLTKGQPASGVVNVSGRTAGAKIMPHIISGLEGSKFGDTVYLTNNLPYAYPIEFYGWSKVKAPAGMVRKNVVRLNRIAEAVARGINNGSI